MRIVKGSRAGEDAATTGLEHVVHPLREQQLIIY